jgi:hypothetical protein
VYFKGWILMGKKEDILFPEICLNTFRLAKLWLFEGVQSSPKDASRTKRRNYLVEIM